RTTYLRSAQVRRFGARPRMARLGADRMQARLLSNDGLVYRCNRHRLLSEGFCYWEYVETMCVRTISSMALLGLLFWLGNDPAWAQASQERVQLILSTLPPPQSATYKALKALADNPTAQALPLTKSEIWSVPGDKVDAVMKAASQHGVGVRQLNERSAADTAPRRRT